MTNKKTKDRATITNPFHPYRGHTVTITNTTKDDEGTLVFVRLGNGTEIMLDPSDITIK
jgi:hypothetical protein